MLPPWTPVMSVKQKHPLTGRLSSDALMGWADSESTGSVHHQRECSFESG